MSRWQSWGKKGQKQWAWIIGLPFVIHFESIFICFSPESISICLETEVLILTVYCSFYINAAGFCFYIFVILRWHETKSFVDRSGFKSNILFLLLKLQMIYISKIVYFILKIIPLEKKRVQPSISITKYQIRLSKLGSYVGS